MASFTPIDLHFGGAERAIGVYLVDTADGPALHDCGPSTTIPVLKAGLAAYGLELHDVRHLLLSHIHLDHAGAAGALVREHPGLAIPLVPDPAPSAQHGAVDRRRPPAVRPGLDAGGQVAAKRADLGGERGRQRRQAPLPGAARREPAVGQRQQGAQRASRRSAGPGPPAARRGYANAARS